MRKLVCYAIVIIAAGTINTYAQKNANLAFTVPVNDAASPLYHIYFVGNGLNKKIVNSDS